MWLIQLLDLFVSAGGGLPAGLQSASSSAFYCLLLMYPEYCSFTPIRLNLFMMLLVFVMCTMFMMFVTS